MITLRPFIRRYFPSLGDSSGSRSRKGHVAELGEGGIRLRQLKSGNKESHRSLQRSRSNTGKETGHNIPKSTSEECILMDREFIIAESNTVQETGGEQGLSAMTIQIK